MISPLWAYFGFVQRYFRSRRPDAGNMFGSLPHWGKPSDDVDDPPQSAEPTGVADGVHLRICGLHVDPGPDNYLDLRGTLNPPGLQCITFKHPLQNPFAHAEDHA